MASSMILFLYCRKTDSAKEITEQNPESEILILNKLQWSENPAVDEMARFIAAMPLPENSRLSKLISNPEYIKYSKNINESWEKYDKNHLAVIRTWQEKEIDKNCGQNLFYPFSGPDIVHAATLFPDVRSFHLFALESPGEFPMPDIKNTSEEITNLKKILSVVGPVLQRPFWRTNDMKVQIGSGKYVGITSVTLFFLSRMNYKVLDAFPVSADENGNLVKLGIEKAATSNAVAIFYKKPSEDKVRALLYFQGDISDGGILKTPGVKKYIRSLNHFSTMLKSASYLLHLSSFDDTRNLILGKSKCLLTDSSGVPFHYINNTNWNLKFYGEYKAPVSLFSIRFQPDLVLATKNNPVKLPFGYGYIFGADKSHLILAQRNPAYPYFEPDYDESDTIGENTIWESPRVIRTRTYSKKDSVFPDLKY